MYLLWAPNSDYFPDRQLVDRRIVHIRCEPVAIVWTMKYHCNADTSCSSRAPIRFPPYDTYPNSRCYVRQLWPAIHRNVGKSLIKITYNLLGIPLDSGCFKGETYKIICMQRPPTLNDAMCSRHNMAIRDQCSAANESIVLTRRVVRCGSGRIANTKWAPIKKN